MHRGPADRPVGRAAGRHASPRRLAAAIAAVGVALAACGSGSPPAETTTDPVATGPTEPTPDSAGAGPARSVLPPVARRVAGQRDAPSTDTIEVWVCDVPADTTEPLYGDLTLRLPLTPDDIVGRTDTRLSAYFAAISHGRYVMHLVAGGTVDMAADETDRDCVDRALDRSSPDSDAVLAVATAEHTATSPGGWGTPGTWLGCGAACSAANTRRAAYVGASDFHPDWGPVPALDLIEHEIGHTLGLPHSGDVLAGESGHTSALDVLSNSAAPRDVDPSRLDGPDTLAIDRLALGWLAVDDVVVADPSAVGEIELAPSTGSRGTRLLLLPIDDHEMLSVEYLPNSGYDAHLPTSGIAVHLIGDAGGTGISREQQTVGSQAPHTDLLTAGESLDSSGWTISVTASDGASAQVTVQVAATPTAG